MCLEKISKKYHGTGYKVVQIDGAGNIYPIHQNEYMSYTKININLARLDSTIFCNDGNNHRSGFHIFTTLRGARAYLRQCKLYHWGRTYEYTIYKVSYDGIMAEGYQDKYKQSRTIVTPAIMFLNKVE